MSSFTINFKFVLRIIAALAIVAFVAGCGGGEDRQAKYLERAKQFYEEENYEKAKIETRNVLQINPKNADARHLFGQLNLAQGDIRKAFGGFISVLEVEPDHIGANISMAEVYLALKGFEKVLEHANKVLAVDEANVKAMGLKALALSESGEKVLGGELARKVLEVDPGSAHSLAVLVQDAYTDGTVESMIEILERGQKANPKEERIAKMKLAVYEALGRNDDVEKELKSLIVAWPEDPSYVGTLSSFYIRESRMDDAEQVLRDYAASREGEIDPKLQVISFLLRHKAQDAAIAEVNKYIEADPEESKFRLALAQLHLFTGDKGEAKAVLEETINNDPRSVSSIEARNMLAGMALQDEDVEGARALLEEVLSIEPENTLALLARARLSIGDREIKAGIADLRAVLKNDIESVDALTLLARAQEMQGNTDLALDNYKKLMVLEKPNVQILASAARLAISSQSYQEAESYIRQALELEADNTQLVTNLIRLLALKEDWTAAEGFIRRLIDSEESKALGYFLEGGLKERIGDADAAIASYRKSLEDEPKAVESLISLARSLQEHNGIEVAISEIDKHCQAYPEQSHCYYTLGTLRAQEGDMEEAVRQLDKALALAPESVSTYKQKAKIYATQGDVENVEQTLLAAIEATDNTNLSFELAGVYLQIGRYEEAEKIYDGLLEENADNLAVKNNLAMVYAEYLATEENLLRARVLIADLQESDNPAYLDTVGWVFYVSGDYDQAVTYLQAAVDKVGSSGLLQYHLAMALYKSGELSNAREHLELALANEDDNFSGREEAKKLLAELGEQS